MSSSSSKIKGYLETPPTLPVMVGNTMQQQPSDVQAEKDLKLLAACRNSIEKRMAESVKILNQQHNELIEIEILTQYLLKPELAESDKKKRQEELYSKHLAFEKLCEAAEEQMKGIALDNQLIDSILRHLTLTPAVASDIADTTSVTSPPATSVPTVVASDVIPLEEPPSTSSETVSEEVRTSFTR